jgi:hypothetical protein
MRHSKYIVGLLVILTAGCASLPLYFPTSEEQYYDALSRTEQPTVRTNSGWQIFKPGDIIYSGSVH